MSEVEELEINLRVDGLSGTRRALSIATWKWISRAGNPRYTVKVKYNALLVESERSTAGKAAVPPEGYVLDMSAALPSAIVELMLYYCKRLFVTRIEFVGHGQQRHKVGML